MTRIIIYTKFFGYHLIGFGDFTPKNFVHVEVDTQLIYFSWYYINFALVKKINVGVSGWAYSLDLVI